MKTLYLIFWSFLFFTIALILSDQILYRLWLVPQLPVFHEIPSYYFLMVVLPLIVVIITSGFMCSTRMQVLLVALAAAFSHILLSVLLESPGYLVRYALEQSNIFWPLQAVLLICFYIAVFMLVWYSKMLLQKTTAHIASLPLKRKHREEPAIVSREKHHVDSMPSRITYHVVPDPNGWLVKKGKAKKASSAHSTKGKALRAASNIAKSHPLSQVVVHNASGVIESDRTFEYRHYKKKRKKKEIGRKIRKALKRNKRKETEERLRRRKAARLGIARAKRRQYARRIAAKKAARKRKK